MARSLAEVGAPSPTPAGLLLALGPLFLVASPAPWGGGGGDGKIDLAPALATIQPEEIEAHVTYLASEELEGRDSPSRGLVLASRYLCAQFAAAGLSASADAAEAWRRAVAEGEPPRWSRAPAAGATYLRPLRAENRNYSRPEPEGCELQLVLEGTNQAFRFGEDYVPVSGMTGEARGELVFAGYGIASKQEKYDDLDGLRLKGKVALILQGEPDHPKRFEGPELSEAASLWRKIAALEEAGVVGVLVVRPRLAATEPPIEDGPPALGYRHSWAFFMGQHPDAQPRQRLPVLEIGRACADELLGESVGELERRIDKSVRPLKIKTPGRIVSLASASGEGDVRMDNVVAVLPGSDPVLAGQWVIVGAHYDHVGVGPRGQIGYGADDNASGTSALIEIAEAMAGLEPRRSVLFAAFAGEEDGMVGSAHLARELPFPKDSLVAMLNLDMIGRGKREVAMVLGLDHNPDLERVLERAKRLARTGVQRIEPCNDRGLFERSDQISFHRIGIPTVFFMEDLPLATNTQYHTWRDRVDLLDLDKIASTARLAFLTTWLLANDDDRPAEPRD